MTITFQLEPWDQYFQDSQDLWPEHYDEIAVTKDRMPMNPDVATYMALEQQGRLQVLTARDDGRMVGYVVTVIRVHMHYADVLCGFEDAYFLSKPYRRGGVGIKMIREAIRHMHAVGCRKVFFMTKVAHDVSSLFEHLGFTRSDVMYSKWIGD